MVEETIEDALLNYFSQDMIDWLTERIEKTIQDNVFNGNQVVMTDVLYEVQYLTRTCSKHYLRTQPFHVDGCYLHLLFDMLIKLAWCRRVSKGKYLDENREDWDREGWKDFYDSFPSIIETIMERGEQSLYNATAIQENENNDNSINLE